MVNGTNTSGRIEVCVSHREGFGTVCDDQWDVLDAQVACRQLGLTDGMVYSYISINLPLNNTKINYDDYIVAIPVRKAYFGMGRHDQAILMDGVSCSGTELALQNCSSSADIDCDHSEDAGVICLSKYDAHSNAAQAHMDMHTCYRNLY